MLAKRLFQKAIGQHQQHSQHNAESCLTSEYLDLRVILHYGIPSTASILAFDPIQRLLAIGTLDGRIKVIGGDNIEGLFISPEQMPYKYLEFLQNQGLLISIRNDNIIQVWSLGSRSLSCSLQWESNITAFSVINGSNFMYLGDEYGVISVAKYSENGELLHLPYNISPSSLAEIGGFQSPVHQPVVGVLPQPCSAGNRVLIAYESGLIILWDIVKAKIVVLRGNHVLQLKNNVDSPRDADSNLRDEASQHPLEDKEISALCWASRDGSILAVGYVDGDILFWKTSMVSSIKDQQSTSTDNVVKLQLSSAEKRLPIIVLHWLPNNKSYKEGGSGYLLIYGGDEIGSSEVLTVLTLEWSSGMETLKCLGRMDLNLSGSFADIACTGGMMGSDKDIALFILTNPGQLNIYDCASLAASVSGEKAVSLSAVDFPVVVPTANPHITVLKLFCLPTNEDSSKVIPEMFAMKKKLPLTLPGNRKWPLTGGVPSHLSSDNKNRMLRVYVAGYQDGSVRMWDATCPVLSPLCAFENRIGDGNMAISVASVSKLGFCFQTLRLAVGDECGLVCLYELSSSDETSFHFVTETRQEVHQLARVKGPQCRAAIRFLNSRVEALEFTNSGAKLAVGHECCRIMVLDMNSLSALFLTDTISSLSSSLISMTCEVLIDGLAEILKHSGTKDSDAEVKNLTFILTKDGAVYVIDSGTGNIISSLPMRLKKDSTALSLYVIESSPRATRGSFGNQKQQLSQDKVVGAGSSHHLETSRNYRSDTDNHSSESNSSREHLDELLVLVCCRDVLRLYTAKSIIQGDNKPVSKIKLSRSSCCWTTTFMKDEKVSGLFLLYETGDLEIRSLPDLKLVKETALMPFLRWNFKANMEKTMSSTSHGHITMVNGSELALISILAGENNFRIPESLPSLHDEVLAAAAHAAMNLTSTHKKKQGNGPRILSGIIRGFKGEKTNHDLDPASISESCLSHLEYIFTRDPFLSTSMTTKNHLEASELNIDDIEIDEPMPLPSTSSNDVHNEKRENKDDRVKLLGKDIDAKPRVRTHEEIIATYRKAEGASSAAGEARNKLLERQEKLQRISKRTEELQSSAEDFASMANELVKVMENRKWYHI